MEAVKGLFGGGDAAKREAQRSRELQQVANERQLSEANRKNEAVGASRKAPRGRRLFEETSTPGSTVIA
jgi:hypothetical protein